MVLPIAKRGNKVNSLEVFGRDLFAKKRDHPHFLGIEENNLLLFFKRDLFHNNPFNRSSHKLAKNFQ
jgi:hypothetical protein